jgi:hypothetical protein
MLVESVNAPVPGGGTVQVGDFEVESNREGQDSMESNLAEAPAGGEATEDPSKAAAVLGRKGGEATAAKRAAAAREEAELEDGESAGKDVKSEGKEKAAKPKPSANAEDRIRQIARQREEERQARVAAEQDAAALRERVARLEGKAGIDPVKEQPSREARPGVERPKRDDFDDYDQYVEAVADWKAEQKFAQRERQAAAHRFAQEHTKTVVDTVQTFRGRMTEVMKADPEFSTKVDERLFRLRPTHDLGENERPGPENTFADELIASEHAPALMLYFTEHEEEVHRLLKLPSPAAIARAMGAIEATLKKPAPAGEERKVSRMPPPIQPVTPSSDTATNIDEIEDFDEWMAKANARDREASRRGRR